MNQITTNEFLNSVLEAEAWKELSQNETFTMEMLEKYSNKLDWHEVSQNSDVLWTIEGIQKFSHKIDWDAFSRNCPENLICEAALERFADRWDWEQISGRDCFYNNWSLLEKFVDRADWSEIITNWYIDKPVEFFNKFQQYIPMAKFQNSNLWDKLVDVRSKELKNEIRGIK